MDEGTFRSGKHPDGSPVAHGIDSEKVALTARVAELEQALTSFRNFYDRRVTDLLNASNRYLERARTAERKLMENGIG